MDEQVLQDGEGQQECDGGGSDEEHEKQEQPSSGAEERGHAGDAAALARRTGMFPRGGIMRRGMRGLRGGRREGEAARKPRVTADCLSGSPYTSAVRGMQTARRRVGRCRAAFWQENLSVSAAESLQAGQLDGTLQHCPIGALQVAIFFVFRLDNEAEA